MSGNIKINPQRSSNYWEPVYSPGSTEFPEWKPTEDDRRTVIGVKEVILDISLFKDNKYITGNNFEKVDFHGELDGKTLTITFKNCNFISCSFRNTVVKNVKFTKCSFNYTTFSLGKFEQCEFRDCKYINIGVSGNTMRMENVYIEPEIFLKNVFLYKDKKVLKEKKTTVFIQWYKLLKTKSVIARKLSNMKPIRAEMELYIESIKVARFYEIAAKMGESSYYILKGSFKKKISCFFSFFSSIFEMIVTFFFGWLSGWGQKIGRTTILGIVSIALFTVLYKKFLFVGLSLEKCILRTCEYWMLFGYTKYPFDNMDMFQQLAIFTNSFFGMLWFAAIIPIIINKMSQSDE